MPVLQRSFGTQHPVAQCLLRVGIMRADVKAHLIELQSFAPLFITSLTSLLVPRTHWCQLNGDQRDMRREGGGGEEVGGFGAVTGELMVLGEKGMRAPAVIFTQITEGQFIKRNGCRVNELT